MKKLILLLLIPLFSVSQLQQTFQYTGDPNHYPSLNSFFTEKITSLDKIVENTDFNNTALSNPHPYTYNLIDGDVKIENSPLPANVNKANAQLLNPLVTEFSFKKGDIGRTFLVLGYNSPTQICVVFLSWNTGTVFGKVSNYNLTNASAAQIVGSTTANMTVNQVGSIKVVGDVIELYKDGVLTTSLNYTALLSSGANVQNRCLGFGFHSYGTSGTAVVTNANYILKEVALKGETTVTHTPIFATVSNGTISANDVWSSQQVYNYTNQPSINLDVSIGGDSHSDIASNYGGCPPNEKWWKILQQRFGWRVNNKSAGGRSLAEKTGESSMTDLSLLNSLDENFTPHVVFIFGASNDFGPDAIPLGTPTDTVKTTFWGGSRFVFNYLKTRYPNSKIIYITPPVIGSSLYVNDATMTRIGSGVKFSDYLVAPKTVCAELGIDVIDLFTYCRELNYQAMMQNNAISSDKLHFNGLGNLYLAYYVERQLRRILEY